MSIFCYDRCLTSKLLELQHFLFEWYSISNDSSIQTIFLYKWYSILKKCLDFNNSQFPMIDSSFFDMNNDIQRLFDFRLSRFIDVNDIRFEWYSISPECSIWQIFDFQGLFHLSSSKFSTDSSIWTPLDIQFSDMNDIQFSIIFQYDR